MAHPQPYIFPESPKIENKRGMQELSSRPLNPQYLCLGHRFVSFVDLRDLQALYSPLPPYASIFRHQLTCYRCSFSLHFHQTILTI